MIKVLRLGHRLGRDARISTHCGLVARAFGAKEIMFSGDTDKKMIKSIENVTEEWGGPFYASFVDWKKTLRDFNGTKVHLTMYGLPLDKKIGEIRKRDKLMIIVGGEKVPGEIYNMVDYNIGVSNQPHSEIAALSVFLDRYFNGKELIKDFKNAKTKVEPCKKGKKIDRL